MKARRQLKDSIIPCINAATGGRGAVDHLINFLLRSGIDASSDSMI